MPSPKKNPKKGSFKKKGNKKFNKEDREEIMKDRPGKNDISWYGDPRLIEAAGRINFTNPLGKPIGWMFDNSGSTHTSISNASGYAPESVPGVMSILIEPGIGFASYGSDISNVFVRNFYSFIRHANSGHTNYAAPDLGIYLMAVDQIYLMLEHCVRIYGVARTFSSMNRYLPHAILEAMGVDPYMPGQELYDNLASYRARLLMLMVKAGTLVVPDNFSFIKRHKDLFQYVYQDGSTTKSQIYVFRPQGYKQFVASGPNHTGGYLEFKPLTTRNYSCWEWLTFCEDIINAVVEDEDMNIMSGDILKAYGIEGTAKLTYFDENYTVVPTYNPEMLLEIHNMRIAGDPWSNTSMDIYQDPSLNIIKYEPIFSTPAPICNISPIIDMPVEVPSPDQIMIATRLTHMGSLMADSSGPWSYKYVPSSIGSEVVTHVNLLQFNNVGGKWTLHGLACYGGEEVSNLVTAFDVIGMLTQFDWHFGFNVITIDPNDANAIDLVGYVGELENYTPVNQGDLQKLHEVALIGEFKVPLMGVSELK